MDHVGFSVLIKIYSDQNANKTPGSTPLDYVMSVGGREKCWIKQHAVPKALDDPLLISTAQNSPEAHMQLLEKFLQVAPYLVDIDNLMTRSTVWHTDLHASNIFIDGDRVAAIIDWQGVEVGPLFLLARPSQLVDYQGNIILKRPENFDNLDDDHKAKIKQQIFRSTLFQLYLLETEERNPTLAKVFHLDHGKTRRLPVELAANSWDDDIVSFREALINVERYSHVRAFARPTSDFENT